MNRFINKKSLEQGKPYLRLRLVFPHVAKNLNEKWGTIELDKYINHLFTDTRGGTRKGFPKAAIEDLNLIRKYHDHLYGNILHQIEEDIEIKDARRDIWGGAF